MPIPQTESAMERYLIRSDDPVQLAEFVKEVNASADMELVDAIGPAGHHHTLVVAMSRARASSLEPRFRPPSSLKIEPDRPLSLFGNAMRG